MRERIVTEPKQAEEIKRERRIEREVEIDPPIGDDKKWQQRLQEIFQNA